MEGLGGGVERGCLRDGTQEALVLSPQSNTPPRPPPFPPACLAWTSFSFSRLGGGGEEVGDQRLSSAKA